MLDVGYILPKTEDIVSLKSKYWIYYPQKMGYQDIVASWNINFLKSGYLDTGPRGTEPLH